MNILDSSNLIKLLDDVNDNKITISNFEIVIENDVNINLCIDSIEFKNCIFKGERIDFYDFIRDDESKDDYCSLSFIDCVIENDLFVKDCYLYSLEFRDVKITSKRFFIAHADIKNVTICGSPENHNKINSIIIDNLNSKELNLDIRLNDFYDAVIISNSFFKSTTINANFINRINISDSEFLTLFQFWKNEMKSYSFIDNNIFNNVEAKDSVFGSETHFNKIRFLGNCNFENVKGVKTKLKFTKCNFGEYVYFDNSNLFDVYFDTTFFKEIVSFQNLKCKSIKFNRTHFDKVAFFHDIKIDLLDQCDLRTIRLIKNQLFKTENKIDYLKYSSVEQNNLLRSEGLTYGDKILLKLNKESNDFGNDWILGVKFTFKKGLMFFILLLIVNSFIKSTYPLCLNLKNTIAPFSEILTEFLKFIFSLGFENKDIQSNGFLYLIFIISKIYIGYGLYQTIFAFRKYGKS